VSLHTRVMLGQRHGFDIYFSTFYFLIFALCRNERPEKYDDRWSVYAFVCWIIRQFYGIGTFSIIFPDRRKVSKLANLPKKKKLLLIYFVFFVFVFQRSKMHSHFVCAVDSCRERNMISYLNSV
jgi:hypothetical protein